MRTFEIRWKEPEDEYSEQQDFGSYEEMVNFVKSELATYGHLGVQVLSVNEIVKVPIQLSEFY